MLWQGCSKKDLHSENDANDAQSCDLLVTGFAGNHDVAEARAHFTGGRRGEVEMMQVVLGPEFRGLEEISFYTYGAPDTVFTIFDVSAGYMIDLRGGHRYSFVRHMLIVS